MPIEIALDIPPHTFVVSVVDENITDKQWGDLSRALNQWVSMSRHCGVGFRMEHAVALLSRAMKERGIDGTEDGFWDQLQNEGDG